MEVVYVKKYDEIYINKDICVAIGNFDGLHLGHMSLINQVYKSELAKGIITFTNHPSSYVSNEIKQILSLEDKIKELSNLDYLIILDFNEELKNLSADDFIKFLQKNNIKEVVCGKDFRFGKNRIGDINLLAKNFKLDVKDDVYLEGVKVSSTLIRTKLKLGEIETVNKLINRIYKISGKVVDGNKQGRKIGFPTANLEPYDYLIPSTGVYATKVLIDGKLYNSMTNIGHNPTFNMSENLKVETYILDFDKDIYGEEISIYFYKKIRDEKKFDSVSKLVLELGKNKIEIVKYFKK